MLLAALLALPFALSICLRHPSLATLSLIAVLCLFARQATHVIVDINGVFN